MGRDIEKDLWTYQGKERETNCKSSIDIDTPAWVKYLEISV